MKKTIIILILAAFTAAIVMLSSCAGTKQATTTDGGEKNLILMTTQKLRALKDFNDNQFVKEIHVFNSATVTYRKTNALKKESKVDDGGVVATTLNSKVLYELEPETPGEIDSVVRFRDDPKSYESKKNFGFSIQDISKLKVKYILEETGMPIYIWYYQKIVQTDEGLQYYFASKDIQEVKIYEIPMKRETSNNRLMWSYKEQSGETKKKSKVVSPFGANKTSPSLVVKPPEEEEQ